MSRTAALLFLLLAPGLTFAQDVRYRSGNIQVQRDVRQVKGQAGTHEVAAHTILRDGINFGFCFDDARYRRVAGTYYHPRGPMGLIFAKMDWFPGAPHTHSADARLPAALTAAGAGSGSLGSLVAAWSEPAIAVIGMEVGTPAAYARPGQHFHFYEPHPKVIELSEGKERFFHFSADARDRGAQIRIVQGSPRHQLREHGPRRFYQLMILESCSGENGEKIFLDFFTVEGIAQCMEHLMEDGILCVHTSHRFVGLPPVLAAIGKELKLEVRVGHDRAPGSTNDGDVAEVGHFTSEWVLLARQRRTLDAVCKVPPNYAELMKNKPFVEGYWTVPEPSKHLWTDRGPNLLHGVLRGHPFAMRYTAVAAPIVKVMQSVLRIVGASHEWQIEVSKLTQLPYGIDQWMVQRQLRDNPEVEKLWR